MALFRHTVLAICNRSCLGEKYVDKELFTLLIKYKIIESYLNFTIHVQISIASLGNFMEFIMSQYS